MFTTLRVSSSGKMPLIGSYTCTVEPVDTKCLTQSGLAQKCLTLAIKSPYKGAGKSEFKNRVSTEAF